MFLCRQREVVTVRDSSHPLHIDDDSPRKKDARVRISAFDTFLQARGLTWHEPDVPGFRDHLLNERKLEKSSVVAYISTIRNHYRNLLKDDDLSDWLRQEAPTHSDPDTFVEDAMARIKTAAFKDADDITFERNFAYTALTPKGCDALLTQPDLSTRQGVRDVVMLGLMLCAGLRDTEIAALRTHDLIVGKRLVHVPEVAGGFERTIPLMDDVVSTTFWLADVIRLYWQIMPDTTAAFHGFYRGGQSVRKTPLTPNGVQRMLRRYEVRQDWSPTALDLRRTFARMAYQNGVAVSVLRVSLGLESEFTVMEYIGPPQRIVDSTDTHRISEGETILRKLEERAWPY